MHLTVRNHIYYFRLKVPVDLRMVFGCCEIRRSLNTCDYQQARTMASVLAFKLKGIIKMVRVESLDSETIAALVKKHIDDVLDSLEYRSLKLAPTSLEEIQEEADFVSSQMAEYKEALATRKWDVVGHIVDGLLDGKNVDTMSHNKLAREVLRSVVDLHPIMKAYVLGDYDEAERLSVKQTESHHDTSTDNEVLAGQEVEQTSITLGDLIEKYKASNQAEWRPSTRNDYETIGKVVTRFISPDTQVHTISRSMMLEYKEVLQCLPRRFIGAKKYEGLTAEDVKQLKSTKVISAETINKNLSFMTGLFNYAIDHEYIERNPASNMKVVNKTAANQKVDEFNTADIQAVFDSPVLGKNHPYQFWVPILGLFTGARREELCNLYAEDIKSEDGVWYIDINMNKPDKMIKTYQTRRVPLHPFVIDLGFISYVKTFDRGHRLWPQLNNNNKDRKYGHYFGRWFNDKLLKPLGIKPTTDEREAGVPNKTFHSFRHTLITLGIRTGLDIQKVKGMVGHKEDGITFGTYFKGFTVKQVYDEVVSRMDHGVNLECLKEHKFSMVS